MLDCLILIEDNLEKYYKENNNPKGIQLILDTLDNENINYKLINYKKIQTNTKGYIVNNKLYEFPKVIISLIVPQPNDKHYKNIRLEFEKHSQHINPYNQVEIVKDKLKTLQFIKNEIPDVKTPKTILLNENTNINQIISFLNLPIIFKPNKGYKGEEVKLLKTRFDLEDTIKNSPPNKYILQEAITESFGQDIRIVTASTEVIYSIKRENNKDFRSNRNKGGKITIYNPNEYLKELSVKISEKLKLNYASIDFLIKNDEYILCEVNSFPGLTLPLSQIKKDDFTIYENLKSAILKKLIF